MTARPYARKSIFDLEAIFERSHSNVGELERLLNELTFRNTAKARILTTKIEQALTALSGRSVVSMPNSRQQFDNDQIDLGRLPSFSPSGKANDARAILAAWTALEALSPQGYKRPEDMASGDRSKVALLERGIPWGP